MRCCVTQYGVGSPSTILVSDPRDVIARLLRSYWPVRSILMGMCFVVNVSAGFVALRLVNIPVFLCIRRTTTVFVMVAEFFVLRKRTSSAIWWVGRVVLAVLCCPQHDSNILTRVFVCFLVPLQRRAGLLDA